MPGTQIFTYANYGKEATRGTPVAPTRQFYAEGTGILDHDPSLNFHEGENTGRRTRVRRATQQAEDVNVKLKTVSGMGFDDMVLPLTQSKGGMTGVGGAADKTWTATPSQTAANNPEAFSWDIGDDTQNWRVQYGMMSRWKLSAELAGVTDFECDIFGQRAVKGAKAAPAANSAVKMVADLWTIAFAGTFAGLGAASAVTNFLVGWELEWFTGLVWRHYMDGNLYGGQHVETSFHGTLTMTVESTAQAVSEFYDKAFSQSLDYIRLRNTGPALGGSNYSMRFDIPVLYQKPSIIDSEDSEVNLYKVVANIADDGTNGFTPTLVCSLSAIP